MSSLHYERLCLLFNVGVLQGQIAAAQNFQSDEGLKTASKMFQVLTVQLYLKVCKQKPTLEKSRGLGASFFNLLVAKWKKIVSATWESISKMVPLPTLSYMYFQLNRSWTKGLWKLWKVETFYCVWGCTSWKRDICLGMSWFLRRLAMVGFGFGCTVPVEIKISYTV